ncbi:MAG: hypothetical protein PF447_04410 [Spirochaetaceae bacterium]|nr:hypothetical protein [Spirochaetaceae bacterium]
MRIASGSVNASRLLGTSQGHKINVPVAPNISPYAQYKYVRGIPAYNRQRAVPVTKLRVLNNIINSLQGIKEQRQSLVTPPKEGLSNDTLDAMIEDYSKQLHQAIKKTSPVFSGHTASTGMAFSLSV